MTEIKADCSAPAILSTSGIYTLLLVFLWLLCPSPFLNVQAAQLAQAVQVAHQDTTAGAVPPQIPSISLEQAVALYESGRNDTTTR